MEFMGSEGVLTSGYKLVPWSSWDQWNFVRESIFSSSPASVSKALQRISTWRSRGCLPVPVDVTAAIIEIQQKDPSFSGEGPGDALKSEELLSMLYCMSIMRLVNCFVEPAHKKTRRSISDLADAVGIPRMLVDIRHESSHRDLPSLRLVRMASVKALDWLKSNYWEPQRSAIPNVRKEIRSRLREMIFHLKRSSASQGKGKRCKRSMQLMRCKKLSSQIAGKLRPSKSDVSDKWITKITKVIARLYSSYPSEVVAVLLEFFHLQSPKFSDGIDVKCSDDANDDDSSPYVDAMCDIKAIITKLSSMQPGLILGILKAVLEMIEVKEHTRSKKSGCHFLSTSCQSDMADINYLCSFVHWLLMNLKALKDSGRIGVVGESSVLSTDESAPPTVSLIELLHRILPLSVVCNMYLSTSVSLLTSMIGNNFLTTKIKKFPLLATQDHDCTGEATFHNIETMLLQEETSIKQATEKLEILKLQIRNRKASSRRSTNESTKMWTVAKSWIPCPIGMLACSFSSTAFLPILDKVEKTLETDGEVEVSMGNVANENISEYESATKRFKATREEQEMDSQAISSPSMEGRLLIGGVWKKVSEEELHDIESNIRIFTEL